MMTLGNMRGPMLAKTFCLPHCGLRFGREYELRTTEARPHYHLHGIDDRR